MSLSQKIAAALDARPDLGALPCRVTAEDQRNRLTLDLTAFGGVGMAFNRLEFNTHSQEEWSSQDLQAWADRITSRVTYLMEPLVVIEHDQARGEIEIRSKQPTARGDRRAYYQLRLNRQGGLSLARLEFNHNQRKRTPAPCQVTREVLERLTDDLVESVN